MRAPDDPFCFLNLRTSFAGITHGRQVAPRHNGMSFSSRPFKGDIQMNEQEKSDTVPP